MLLGLSGLESDDHVDPTQLRDGAGVAAGRELVAFVDAVIAGGDSAADGRVRLAEVLDEAAMVDAAAVVANFFMMTRIADATGTPLDEHSAALAGDLSDALGIDGFTSKRMID